MKLIFRNLKNLVRSIAVIVNKPRAHLPPHCGNINSLLLHLCDFDAELHKWVLQWIAYPLRNPGAKMGTCLLINGGEGTGKNLFFEGVVAKLYGDAARVLPGTRLFEAYKPWADSARFVVIDGDYSTPAAIHLKALVTNDRVFLDKKPAPPKMVPNHMNFVFVSGEFDFLPAGAQDRRFMVIEAPPAQKPFFYRAVANEIQNGGIDAFHEFLMFKLDMTGFDTHTLPPAAPHYRQTKEAA